MTTISTVGVTAEDLRAVKDLASFIPPVISPYRLSSERDQAMRGLLERLHQAVVAALPPLPNGCWVLWRHGCQETVWHYSRDSESDPGILTCFTPSTSTTPVGSPNVRVFEQTPMTNEIRAQVTVLVEMED